MSTKKKFYEIAENNGIDVWDYSPHYVDRWTGDTIPFHIMLDAPRGMLFAGTETHCFGGIGGTDDKPKTDWKYAVKELQEIISYGFEPCDNPECDMCHPLGDEE